MIVVSVVLYLVAIVLFVIGAIAVPYSLIYLTGAIGTGGREYVGELSVLSVVVVIGFGGGIGLWRLATAIRRRAE